MVADITTATNKAVTITATFSEDSAVKQYKIGDGEWMDYTAAFTVSENVTIYFRAEDAAGNVSEITEYVVNNITPNITINGDGGMTHAEAIEQGLEPGTSGIDPGQDPDF